MAGYYTYKDYKGFPTIGPGLLVRPTDDYSRGLSLDEVMALFHHRMGDIYAAISRHVSYDYNQAEFDSMCCSGWNLGPGFFTPANSTPIRCLNVGDVDGYCKHLLEWNRSNGQYDPNLFARRQREAAWFREPPPPDDHPLFTDEEKAAILSMQLDLVDVAREEEDRQRRATQLRDTEPPPTERNS